MVCGQINIPSTFLFNAKYVGYLFVTGSVKEVLYCSLFNYMHDLATHNLTCEQGTSLTFSHIIPTTYHYNLKLIGWGYD